MATRVKIKIADDAGLRQILDGEYAQSSQVELCRYALQLASHILAAAGCEDMGRPAIQEGYAVNERWQAGAARMHDVRQAGFQIHKLAKNCPDIVAQTALRAVGQAVSAGHMREHAMVASDYAVKVVNLLFPNDMAAVRRERTWQIERLRSVRKESAPRWQRGADSAV